jgi:hypothetical protein
MVGYPEFGRRFKFANRFKKRDFQMTNGIRVKERVFELGCGECPVGLNVLMFVSTISVHGQVGKRQGLKRGWQTEIKNAPGTPFSSLLIVGPSFSSNIPPL